MIWLPQLLAGLMLAWGLLPFNPYGYYIVLRWFCCGTFCFLAFRAFEQGRTNWVWILGILAALYNPVFRTSMSRGSWAAVNIATIGIAAVSVFALEARGAKARPAEPSGRP